MAAKKRRPKSESSESKVAVPQVASAGVVIAPHDPDTGSIEFSRDAKGVARWTIKIGANRDDMKSVLDDLDRELRARTSEGDDG